MGYLSRILVQCRAEGRGNKSWFSEALDRSESRVERESIGKTGDQIRQRDTPHLALSGSLQTTGATGGLAFLGLAMLCVFADLPL